MTDLARALVDALDPDDLAALAQRLAPYLPERSSTATADRWLTAREAADYLAISYSTIRKRMAAGELPCEREGRRVYFRRSALDAWRA